MEKATACSRAVLVAAVACVLLGLAPHIASARGSEEAALHTVTAVGEGELVVEPDRAIVTVGVQLYDESVRDASTELRRRMEAVIAAIRAVGVPAEQIQTTNYSIFFERDHQAPPQVGRRDGGQPAGSYRVENMVRVTIEDATRAAAVVDAAVAAGANQMYGIQFTIAEPGDYDTQVRRRAVESARERATGLAAAAGRELGPAIEVTEVLGGGGPAYESRMLGAGGGGPVQPGGLVYTARVQVTYELK